MIAEWYSLQLELHTAEISCWLLIFCNYCTSIEIDNYDEILLYLSVSWSQTYPPSFSRLSLISSKQGQRRATTKGEKKKYNVRLTGAAITVLAQNILPSRQDRTRDYCHQAWNSFIFLQAYECCTIRFSSYPSNTNMNLVIMELLNKSAWTLQNWKLYSVKIAVFWDILIWTSY